MDKLDLLGVRNDVEMEQQAKYELAKEVYEYWDTNCTDDDFYDNCINDIIQRLGENGKDNNCVSDEAYEIVSDEVYEIWNIIEKEFL